MAMTICPMKPRLSRKAYWMETNGDVTQGRQVNNSRCREQQILLQSLCIILGLSATSLLIVT